jgi:hypothetical protein
MKIDDDVFKNMQRVCVYYYTNVVVCVLHTLVVVGLCSVLIASRVIGRISKYRLNMEIVSALIN